MRKILFSILLLLIPFLLSSCVSREQYNKKSQELDDAQSQIQLSLSEQASLRNQLAEIQTQYQKVNEEISSVSSRNQLRLDEMQKQTATYQSQIEALRLSLDSTQTQAQNSVIYADFLDLLMTSVWKIYEIPSTYEYNDVNDYGEAIISKAGMLKDSKVDKYVSQIIQLDNSGSYYEAQKVTMLLFQYILQKIEDLPPSPELVSPSLGVIMDNGRSDWKDNITWEFDWSDVGGATDYQIYVIGSNALIPSINLQTNFSSYTQVRDSYIADQNRFGWKWRVRAKVEGKWSGWSEEWTFNVEPLNTDPPKVQLN